MQKSKPGPDRARCACGRLRSEASIHVYTSSRGRWAFKRCACGEEWTEHEEGVDRSQPVSTDEVLEVHERLAGFQGSLQQLLGKQTA